MWDSYNGSIGAFQALGEGSIPLSHSISPLSICGDATE